MQEQDLDRSEAATPFKLQQAREQGRTARSVDLVAGLVFGTAMVFASWQASAAAASLLRSCRTWFVQLPAMPPHGALPADAIQGLLADAAALVLPLFLLLVLSAVAATWLQGGLVLSLHPLKADFTRLSPVSGFRRLFSARTLFDAVRACVKLAVLVLAAGLALGALLPRFFQLAAMPPAAFLRTLLDDVAGLGLELAAALLLIAAFDVAWSRRDFLRHMRMSRRELKDEFRQRDGDPRIRARMRELRRELVQRSRALHDTRDADVVLTNPTHYAVALRYEHGEMAAPRLVAKGAGVLAAAIRAVAARHGVPVVQNPPLARSLFRAMRIDDELPAAYHPDVARILVWVFAQRQQRRRGGPA